MVMSEEEMKKVVEEEITPEINQETSIDPSVEQHLNEMGWIWNSVFTKLQADATCCRCKKAVSKDEKMNVLEMRIPDKGVVAFGSLCQSCILKIQEEQKEAEKNATDKKA